MRETTCFTVVSCLACPSPLEMELICSSETSVNFHRTTQRYIPDDRDHGLICQYLIFAIQTAMLNSTRNIEKYWFFGLFPSSGILGTRKHDVSETGTVSETSCLIHLHVSDTQNRNRVLSIKDNFYSYR
jgi:hypothetical protein